MYDLLARTILDAAVSLWTNIMPKGIMKQIWCLCPGSNIYIIKYLLPRNSCVSSIWILIFDTIETQICSADYNEGAGQYRLNFLRVSASAGGLESVALYKRTLRMWRIRSQTHEGAGQDQFNGGESLQVQRVCNPLPADFAHRFRKWFPALGNNIGNI